MQDHQHAPHPIPFPFQSVDMDQLLFVPAILLVQVQLNHSGCYGLPQRKIINLRLLQRDLQDPKFSCLASSIARTTTLAQGNLGRIRMWILKKPFLLAVYSQHVYSYMLLWIVTNEEEGAWIFAPHSCKEVTVIPHYPIGLYFPTFLKQERASVLCFKRMKRAFLSSCKVEVLQKISTFINTANLCPNTPPTFQTSI